MENSASPAVANQPSSMMWRRRVETLVVISPAILCVVVAATVCIGRPDCLAALTLVPPWCWLLAGLASTVAVWRVRLRRFAVGLGLWWIVFAMGWVEELPALTRAALIAIPSNPLPEGRPIRIASLNCANTERCLADLERLHPEIVLLQEAPGAEGLARMSARLFGDAGSFLGGGDTAILARGQMFGSFTDRNAHFVMGTVKFDDGRQLQCVSLRLAPPIARLDFWSRNFWLDHRERRDMHRRQLHQVMLVANSCPPTSAVLVGGDFNTTPLDRALDEMRPQLTDSFRQRGVGRGASGTNEWPLFRVDQIWTNSRIVPSRTYAIRTVHSDHRMIVCEAVLAHEKK